MYKVYIGGAKHHANEAALVSDMTESSAIPSLPIVQTMPLFDISQDDSHIFSTKDLHFNDNHPYFFTITTLDKTNTKALGTNLTIGLIPTSMHTFNNVLAKIKYMRLDRIVEIHDTGAQININEKTDHQFVNSLKNKCIEHLSNIALTLINHKVTFDSCILSKNKGKPMIIGHKPINLITKENTHTLEREVFCVGRFECDTPSVVTTKEALYKAKMIPNHFLDQHFLFQHFSDIELKVNNEKSS